MQSKVHKVDRGLNGLCFKFFWTRREQMCKHLARVNPKIFWRSFSAAYKINWCIKSWTWASLDLLRQDLLLEAAWEIPLFLQEGVWPAAVPVVTRREHWEHFLGSNDWSSCPLSLSCPLPCPACHHCPHPCALGFCRLWASGFSPCASFLPLCSESHLLSGDPARGPAPLSRPHSRALGTASAPPRAQPACPPSPGPDGCSAQPGGRWSPLPLLLSPGAALAACAAQIRWPEFPQAALAARWRGAAGHGAQRPQPRSAATASTHRPGLSSPRLARKNRLAGTDPRGLVVLTRGAWHLLKDQLCACWEADSSSSSLTRAPAGAMEGLPGRGGIKLARPFSIGYFVLHRRDVPF